MKTMHLTDFFRESDFSFGVFYPRHCITAVFSSLPPAQRAEQALRRAGFEPDHIIVAAGSEVIDFDRDHTTLESLVMRAVSRFFKTEQSFNDLNLEHVRHGAGLLAVRCPDENQKDNAWQIIKEEDPLDAR